MMPAKTKQGESGMLASYAMKAKQSRGRLHPEKEHPFRSAYQRDRDRIIHSTAFRRLEYKTQVFVNHEGDYYRTRLTHTLEVSQIARTIARALALNEDLVEAISLAHDIGHPPFGHSGEETLRELMADHGGFDHNFQGLRIVDYLEERYPRFKGLNLTWETREGINKHTTPFDSSKRLIQLEPERQPLLEAQVVDLADEIAYDNHDLDDGLTSGLIAEAGLMRIPLWKEVEKDIAGRYASLNTSVRKYLIIKTIIDRQASDLVNETRRLVKKFKLRTPEAARAIPQKIVAFSEDMNAFRRPLKDYLFKYLYNHYRVVRMSDKAKRILRGLFGVYLEKPEQLPPSCQASLETEGLHRTICDYIAGMTDRYAIDEYNKLFNPYEKV